MNVTESPCAIVNADCENPIPTDGSTDIVYVAASASGTINGIDGGTKSIDTRKIPKRVVKFDVLVMIWLAQTIFKVDHYTSMLDK